MKQSKHMMSDLYFQSSPPLTLVMDFFIYQQLSLSFNICPAQPILRFKCSVKQIHALMFFCHLQLMFCSCRCSRTGPRCANRVPCALLAVLWAVPNTDSGYSQGLLLPPGTWAMGRPSSHVHDLVSPPFVVTAGLQLANAGAPFCVPPFIF